MDNTDTKHIKYRRDKVNKWLSNEINDFDSRNDMIVSEERNEDHIQVNESDESTEFISVSQRKQNNISTDSSDKNLLESYLKSKKKVYSSLVKPTRKQLKRRQLPNLFDQQIKQKRTLSKSITNLKRFVHNIQDDKANSKTNYEFSEETHNSVIKQEITDDISCETFTHFLSPVENSHETPPRSLFSESNSDTDWSESKSINLKTVFVKPKKTSTKLNLRSIYRRNKCNNYEQKGYKKLISSDEDILIKNSKDKTPFKQKKIFFKNKRKNKLFVFKANSLNQAKEIYDRYKEVKCQPQRRVKNIKRNENLSEREDEILQEKFNDYLNQENVNSTSRKDIVNIVGDKNLLSLVDKDEESNKSIPDRDNIGNTSEHTVIYSASSKNIDVHHNDVCRDRVTDDKVGRSDFFENDEEKEGVDDKLIQTESVTEAEKNVNTNHLNADVVAGNSEKYKRSCKNMNNDDCIPLEKAFESDKIIEEMQSNMITKKNMDLSEYIQERSPNLLLKEVEVEAKITSKNKDKKLKRLTNYQQDVDLIINTNTTYEIEILRSNHNKNAHEINLITELDKKNKTINRNEEDYTQDHSCVSQNGDCDHINEVASNKNKYLQENVISCEGNDDLNKDESLNSTSENRIEEHCKQTNFFDKLNSFFEKNCGLKNYYKVKKMYKNIRNEDRDDVVKNRKNKNLCLKCGVKMKKRKNKKCILNKSVLLSPGWSKVKQGLKELNIPYKKSLEVILISKILKKNINDESKNMTENRNGSVRKSNLIKIKSLSMGDLRLFQFKNHCLNLWSKNKIKLSKSMDDINDYQIDFNKNYFEELKEWSKLFNINNFYKSSNVIKYDSKNVKEIIIPESEDDLSSCYIPSSQLFESSYDFQHRNQSNRINFETRVSRVCKSTDKIILKNNLINEAYDILSSEDIIMNSQEIQQSSLFNYKSKRMASGNNLTFKGLNNSSDEKGGINLDLRLPNSDVKNKYFQVNINILCDNLRSGPEENSVELKTNRQKLSNKNNFEMDSRKNKSCRKFKNS